MLLNNVIKLGSLTIRGTVKTAEILSPLVSKVSVGTTNFVKKEVALGKLEVEVQRDLINADVAKAREVMKTSGDAISKAFNTPFVMPKAVVAAE